MNLSLLKNWWWLTINGIAAVLFGVTAILYAEMSLVLLLAYFGLLAVFLGAFFMLGAYLNRSETKLSDFWFFEGVLNTSIGVILLFYNGVTLPAFMVLLALWALLVGAIQVISVFRLWIMVPHRSLYLINGFLAFIFGLIIIINPFHGVHGLTIYIGVYTVVLGIFSILISISMKNANSDQRQNQSQTYLYHHDK